MIDPQFEPYLREKPGLTYASSDQPWVARQVTRSVERALGRRRLEKHYFALKAGGLSSQDFFQLALIRSGVQLNADFSPLEQIDKGRPLTHYFVRIGIWPNTFYPLISAAPGLLSDET